MGIPEREVLGISEDIPERYIDGCVYQRGSGNTKGGWVCQRGRDRYTTRMGIPNREGVYQRVRAGIPEREGQVYQREVGIQRGRRYTREEEGIPEGVGIPEREDVYQGTCKPEGGYVHGYGYVQGIGMYTHPQPPLDMGPGYQLRLLTPTGGHHNMYSWQASSTHPTGMLSCFFFFVYHVNVDSRQCLKR